MARVDRILIMHVIHGVGTKELKQNLFICETIWTMKNIQDDDANIS
jgi:hypothetical protein